MNFWENKIGDVEIAQGLKDIEIEKKDDGRIVSSVGHLAVDVYQDKDYLVVLAPLVGVELDEIELTLEDGILTIIAERSVDEKLLTADFLVQECYWGEVRRSIVLPEGLDMDKVEAESKRGVLVVKFPKLKKKKVKKIVI